MDGYPRTVITAWLAIRIDDARGVGEARGLRRRTLLIPPDRTFGHLAESLNLALARWDPESAHEFVLADGRRIGPLGSDTALIDEDCLSVGETLSEGDEFSYRLGESNVRRCRVLATNIERDQLTGQAPP